MSILGLRGLDDVLSLFGEDPDDPINVFAIEEIYAIVFGKNISPISNFAQQFVPHRFQFFKIFQVVPDLEIFLQLTEGIPIPLTRPIFSISFVTLDARNYPHQVPS